MNESAGKVIVKCFSNEIVEQMSSWDEDRDNSNSYERYLESRKAIIDLCTNSAY